MKCDYCHRNDFNEVLVLRKEKFTQRGKNHSKCNRVCFECAKRLTNKGLYDLGSYWNGLLLSIKTETWRY